jgi:general secretion pathway protein G
MARAIAVFASEAARAKLMPLAIVEDQTTVVAHRGRGFPLIQMRTKIRQQGFTLLEIMLVVSIIVIILGVAISKLGNTTAIAKTMRVQADVQAIKTQLQLYESMNGFFPTTEQGLQALVTQPQNDPRPTRWYQLFRELPKDPWGSDYIYRYPGLKNPGGYDLYSAGQDRQADTADDDWGGN